VDGFLAAVAPAAAWSPVGVGQVEAWSLVAESAAAGAFRVGEMWVAPNEFQVDAQAVRAWPAESPEVSRAALVAIPGDGCSLAACRGTDEAAAVDLMDSQTADVARCGCSPAGECLQDCSQAHRDAEFRRGSLAHSVVLGHSVGEQHCDSLDRRVARPEHLAVELHSDFQEHWAD
jgi:hypothetical protein